MVSVSTNRRKTNNGSLHSLLVCRDERAPGKRIPCRIYIVTAGGPMKDWCVLYPISGAIRRNIRSSTGSNRWANVKASDKFCISRAITRYSPTLCFSEYVYLLRTYTSVTFQFIVVDVIPIDSLRSFGIYYSVRLFRKKKNEKSRQLSSAENAEITIIRSDSFGGTVCV